MPNPVSAGPPQEPNGHREEVRKKEIFIPGDIPENLQVSLPDEHIMREQTDRLEQVADPRSAVSVALHSSKLVKLGTALQTSDTEAIMKIPEILALNTARLRENR